MVWVVRDDGGCGPTTPIRLAPRIWVAGVGDTDYIIRSCDHFPGTSLHNQKILLAGKIQINPKKFYEGGGLAGARPE